MLDPALAFIGLAVAFVQLSGVVRTGQAWYRPRASAVTFGVVPVTTTVMYLVWGPVNELLSVASGGGVGFGFGSRKLFADVHSMSMLERVARYLSYVYVDFWWHLRGFDTGPEIAELIGSLQSILGPLFPIYASGWLAITLSLTAAMTVGIGVMWRSRGPTDVFVLTWIGTYVILYNLKNLGWEGAFQTRHVFQLFPALCLAFGLGARALLGREFSALNPVSVSLERVRGRSTVLVVAVGLCLVVLLVNAAGQGLVTVADREANTRESVAQLQALETQADRLAVIESRHYFDVVILTSGRSRPVVFADSASTKATYEDRYHGLMESQVVSAARLDDFDSQYLLYLESPCGGFTDREQRYYDAALDAGGTVLYHHDPPDRPLRTCTQDIYVLRL